MAARAALEQVLHAYKAFEQALLGCSDSSDPSSLAQLRDCAVDLVAACDTRQLAHWLPLWEDGGHLKTFMALFETHFPQLLQEALAQSLPRRALLELLAVFSSLYAALSSVADSSSAGMSYMSRATAAALPLLPLLPEDLEENELAFHVLAGFLTYTRLRVVELKQLCSKQPQLLCWAVPRLVRMLRQRLPRLEDYLSTPSSDLSNDLPCLINAANEAADVASDCLMLLNTVSGTCSWNFEAPGMAGAADGTMLLLEVHSQAAQFLHHLERRMGPGAPPCEATREQWLNSLISLGTILRQGYAAATEDLPLPLGPATKQVARLVWEELCKWSTHKELQHVSLDSVQRRISTALAASRLQATHDARQGHMRGPRRLTVAASLVLTLLVKELRLRPMAAAAPAVDQGSGGKVCQPWDFIDPSAAARLVSLADYLSSKLDAEVKTRLQVPLGAVGVADRDSVLLGGSLVEQLAHAFTAALGVHSSAQGQLTPRHRRQEPAAATLSEEELRRREAEALAAAEALLREEDETVAQRRAAEEAKAAKQRAKRERQRQQRLAQQAQSWQQQQETEVEYEKEAQTQTHKDVYEHVDSQEVKPASPAAAEPTTIHQQQPSAQRQQRRQRRRQQQRQQQPDGAGPGGTANPSNRAGPGPQAPQEAPHSSAAGSSTAPEARQGVELPHEQEADEDEGAELSLMLSSMGIGASPELLSRAEPNTAPQGQQRGQEEQQWLGSQQRQLVPPPAPAAPATPEAAQPATMLPGTAPPEHPAAAAHKGTASQPEDDTCVVCMEGPKESVLVPCGHQALCKACTLGLFGSGGGEGRECPICRVAVTQYLLQVFRC